MVPRIEAAPHFSLSFTADSLEALPLPAAPSPRLFSVEPPAGFASLKFVLQPQLMPQPPQIQGVVLRRHHF